MNHDLTFVAPERRAEVRRRIEAIERFMANPGRSAAEATAAKLGLRVAQFYNLVRAWRDYRRPDAIAGAGAPRQRRSQLSTAQSSVINDIIVRNSRAATSEIVSEIMEAAAAEGVALPDRGSVSRHVRRIRPNLLSHDLARDVDLIVDHTVLDLPVRFDCILRRPLATMVIDVADDAIVSLVLSSATPNPRATAAAIREAAKQSLRNQNSAKLRRPRISVTARESQEVAGVLEALECAGLEAVMSHTGKHGAGQAIESLLGSQRAGIRLKPRLVWNEGHRRIFDPGVDGVLCPAEASALARGRLLEGRVTRVFGLLNDAARLRLMNDLALLAQVDGND